MQGLEGLYQHPVMHHYIETPVQQRQRPDSQVLGQSRKRAGGVLGRLAVIVAGVVGHATATPRKMILSIIRRENTSMEATLRCLSSMIVGLMYAAVWAA